MINESCKITTIFIRLGDLVANLQNSLSDFSFSGLEVKTYF